MAPTGAEFANGMSSLIKDALKKKQAELWEKGQAAYQGGDHELANQILVELQELNNPTIERKILRINASIDNLIGVLNLDETFVPWPEDEKTSLIPNRSESGEDTRASQYSWRVLLGLIELNEDKTLKYQNYKDVLAEIYPEKPSSYQYRLMQAGKHARILNIHINCQKNNFTSMSDFAAWKLIRQGRVVVTGTPEYDFYVYLRDNYQDVSIDEFLQRVYRFRDKKLASIPQPEKIEEQKEEVFDEEIDKNPTEELSKLNENDQIRAKKMWTMLYGLVELQPNTRILKNNTLTEIRVAAYGTAELDLREVKHEAAHRSSWIRHMIQTCAKKNLQTIDQYAEHRLLSKITPPQPGSAQFKFLEYLRENYKGVSLDDFQFILGRFTKSYKTNQSETSQDNEIIETEEPEENENSSVDSNKGESLEGYILSMLIQKNDDDKFKYTSSVDIANDLLPFVKNKNLMQLRRVIARSRHALATTLKKSAQSKNSQTIGDFLNNRDLKKRIGSRALFYEDLANYADLGIQDFIDKVLYRHVKYETHELARLSNIIQIDLNNVLSVLNKLNEEYGPITESRVRQIQTAINQLRKLGREPDSEEIFNGVKNLKDRSLDQSEPTPEKIETSHNELLAHRLLQAKEEIEKHILSGRIIKTSLQTQTPGSEENPQTLLFVERVFLRMRNSLVGWNLDVIPENFDAFRLLFNIFAEIYNDRSPKNRSQLKTKLKQILFPRVEVVYVDKSGSVSTINPNEKD